MTKEEQDNLIWRALADGTRREVLDALAQASLTTGELVERFPHLCRTAVMKHLDVLEAADLIRVRREGRVRWNDINPMPIQTIYDRWVSKHIQGVVSAANRLKRHAEASQRAKQKRKSRS